MNQDNFLSNLRLNILELFQPSAARLNRKSFSLPDISAKLKAIYILSSTQISLKTIKTQLGVLEEKDLIKHFEMDGVLMWGMTDEGEKVLKEIHEGTKEGI